MNNKERYRAYCTAFENEVPIYSQHWWLDAVCGEENWDVALIEKNKEVVASLPYYTKSVKGLSILTMPKLTQQLGILMHYPEGQKPETKNNFEKKTITSLIEQLPEKDAYRMSLNINNNNWLPFYWKGFQQTTFYTYILKDIKALKQTHDNFRASVKKEIRKAEKQLTVHSSEDIGAFYAINSLTFTRQNKKPPYGLDFLSRLDAACKEKKARKIYFAKDAEGQVHAGLYVVYDANKAYYLMGGADPSLRNSGASTFLMWHAIQEASKLVDQFDFEGSMIQSIERFVSGFGGFPTPYSFVEKTNSKLLKLKNAAATFKKSKK